jgi:hypothetical protein
LISLFTFIYYLAAKIGGASTEKKKAFFLFCVRLALRCLAAKIGGASTEKKKAFFLFCVRLALSLPHEKKQRV